MKQILLNLVAKIMAICLMAMFFASIIGIPFLVAFGALLFAGYLMGYAPKGSLLNTISPELKKELDALKAALIDKAKTETTAQVDALKAQIVALEAKAKDLDVKALTDSIDALKTTLAAIETANAKNQPVIDAFVNERSHPTTNTEKSFATILKEAIEEATDNLQKFARKETKSVSIDLKTVGDITTSNVTGTTVYGAQSRTGIIENPNRLVHMRQIVPGGTVGAGNDYYFMRENGNGEGNPAMVAEGAAKSQFDFDLVESSVKIETLAGYVRATRKAMQNIPGFISFLQSRMPHRLLNVEDNQILYGSGSTPDLAGLITTGGSNFVASASTASVLAEAIIDDISLLEDTYERAATAVVLRPIDYNGFFKNKASGSGEYDLPANVIFVNGQLYIGGVPVYKTTGLTSGDYIVGDFMNGAQFLIQNAMRLEFFEQDADNVTKNKITVRIEEDVCLPVFGSNYFIKGAVPAAV